MAVTTTLARIPLDAIRVTELRTSWRTQARLAPGAMKELVRSVSARGWLQAVTVRRLGESQFELLDGERRLVAARKAGDTDVDAVILDADDAMAAAIALLADLGGKKLKAIEKALACAQVREALSSAGAKATQEAVGEWVGLAQPTVQVYLEIAEAFDAETLATAGLTPDDLVPYPAVLLQERAKLTLEERTTWLEKVRDGTAGREVRGASAAPDLRGQRVRELKDACLNQPPKSAPADTAAVLVELLPLFGILLEQVVASAVASAIERVPAPIRRVSSYRTPIIRLLEGATRLRALWSRIGGWLRDRFGRLASRVRRWITAYVALCALALGSPRPVNVPLRQFEEDSKPVHGRAAARGSARDPPS